MKISLINYLFVVLIIMSCSKGNDSIAATVSDENAMINGNEDTTSTSDYNILFIGNSLTASNNLPNLVKEKVEEKGISISVESLVKPNYAIVDHWAQGKVQELIKLKKYQYVVIQQGPSSQQDGFDMLVNGGKQYAELCAANDAKLVYFMVWPTISWYNTFDGVIANYTAGANANNALLCPVGKVWKEYIDATGDFSYYGTDGFHPSLKGSEVAAEVIVNTLFN